MNDVMDRIWSVLVASGNHASGEVFTRRERCLGFALRMRIKILNVSHKKVAASIDS